MKKRYIVTATVFLACAASVPLFAADLSVSAAAGNLPFDDDGDLRPAKIQPGFAFSFTDVISGDLAGILSFESDPVGGNLLSARASWKTSFLGVSAGPSFGVLNSDGDADDVSVLLQPGLGIGFSFTLPGIVVATADTDFALPPTSVSGGQAFVQKSRLSAGFFFPNVLCTLAISQRGNYLYSFVKPRMRNVTDYGLYTEAYRKGGPWRAGVDFIYRVQDYYVAEESDANLKIGNLVLGGALTWSPKSDFGIFASGNGSLYSFSLNDAKPDDLDKFYFEAKAGVTMKIGVK
jgi:hypothetical protein